MTTFLRNLSTKSKLILLEVKAMSQVRVGKKTHELIRMLSAQENKSMQEIIERAIEDYRRRQFLEGLNSDFQALSDDPRAQKEHDKEMALWDHTLHDGLEKA